jgi:hypothetical protein
MQMYPNDWPAHFRLGQVEALPENLQLSLLLLAFLHNLSDPSCYSCIDDFWNTAMIR